MPRNKSDDAKKHLTELQSLAPPERLVFLNRLREEDSSLYSRVTALLESAGDADKSFQPETIEYRLDQCEIPTDSLIEGQPKDLPGDDLVAICQAFTERLEKGESPKIEEYLTQVVEASRAELLEELVQLEIRARQVDPDDGVGDYTRRFPDFREAVERAFLYLDEVSAVIPDNTTRVGDWSDPQDSDRSVRTDDPVDRSVMFGEYEILREIARGGMGIVVEARQRSLNRKVALKMIRSGALADQEEVLRFRAEAENAAQLNHPHIVPVYEVGEHKGQHYFTMALVEGESLAARLRKGPLPSDEAARILRLVANGVQYAHERGVVHRDLKPGNILLDDAGMPKVADFGLAKQIGQDSKITVTGCVLGTPSFMPPEQARGEEAGTYSDVYSLGAIFYTMLTNHPPFQAANSAETIQQVKEKEPVPPRQLNPAIKQDLQTICLKCLEKNPARRYESCQALSDELDRYLSGRPILARPVSAIERGWRWCVRHPARAALLLVSLLALIAAGFGVYFSQLANLREQEYQAVKKIADERQKRAVLEKFYSILSKVRELIAAKPMGWTWAADQLLAEAAALGVESKDPREPRKLAAAVKSAFDLRSVAKFRDINPGEVAINREGTRLAVSTYKGVPSAEIYLYDLTLPPDEMPLRKNFRVYRFSTISGNLWRLAGGNATRFQERINSIEFAPDGRWLFAGTRHGMIHAWDLNTPGEPQKSWQAHADEIRDMTVTHDSELLISAAADEVGRTKCWGISEGFPLVKSLDLRARGISLNHIGTRLIIAGDGRVDAFDRRTFEPVARLSRADVHHRCVAASPMSELAALDVQSSEVSLIDLRDGSLQATLTDPLGVNFDLQDLCFTRSGLVFAACDDDTVRIWDSASSELLASLGAGGQYDPEIAADPEGRWLATTNAGMTELYEVRVPELQQVAGIASGEIVDLEFSGAGDLVTLVEKSKTAPEDLAGSWLETWDLSSGLRRRQQLLGLTGRGVSRRYDRARSEGRPKQSLDLSNDLKTAAILTRRAGPSLLVQPNQERILLPRPEPPSLKVWQETIFKTDDGQKPGADRDDRASDGSAVKLAAGESLRWKIPGKSSLLAFVSVRIEPGSEPIATEPVLESWVRKKGKDQKVEELKAEEISNRLEPDSYVLLDVAEVNPAGCEFGIKAGRGVKAVWVDRVVTVSGHEQRDDPKFPIIRTGGYRSLSLSPDGNRLWALGRTENLIGWEGPDWKVFHHSTGTLESRLSGTGGFTTIEAANNGLVIGHRRGQVSTHKIENGRLKLIAKCDEFDGVIEEIALHPHGKLAIVGCSRGEMKLMETDTGRVRQVFDPHRLAVRALDFSPDGHWVASGSRDQMVRIWRETPKGYERHVDLGPFSAAVKRLRFSRDGRKLAVLIQGERGVRIWDFEKLRME